MADRKLFLEKLLEEYRKSFDITQDYEIGGVYAAAYGYFSTVSEKYVLSPKANLWSIHGYEHILFLERDMIDDKALEDIRELMERHMAPELVCKGKKYPEKDHMYSYLTVAYLCEHSPAEEVLRSLEKFRYEKDYLFNFRGHTEAHLVLMDLAKGKAYANKAAKHLVAFYENVYNGVSVIE